MTNAQEHQLEPARKRIVQSLAFVEDIVYVGLGILLASSALSLLVTASKNFAIALWNHALATQVVSLLDQVLLVLLVVELLYTVQVSFRVHGLLAEPFLVVALIAVIRRILVLTAEVSRLPEAGEVIFRHYMYELAVLTLLILVLVASLVTLQRRRTQQSAE